MDNLKRNELGRRSLKIVNEIDSFLPLKPLGVSNTQTTYERKSFYGSLQKSPTNARKTLFDAIAKENDDFSLCKDFSTNRENTGKSPVVIHKIKHSNGSQDKKKVKPRRSMLGLRSKTQLNFVKDDVTFTVSKQLQASSPKNTERVENHKSEDLKPLSQRSISTPALTPFDTDETNTSAFFDKGISDSTWSVFKSIKKKSNFEPPVTRQSIVAGKTRSLAPSDRESNLKNNSSKFSKSTDYEQDTIKTRSKTRSLVSSVDQEAKLKWLAQKFQMEGNNHMNLPLSSRKEDLKKKQIIEETNSEDSYTSQNEESSIDHDEGYEVDKMVSPLRGPVPENVSPIETITYVIQEDLNDSVNSTDSYIENEKTILNSGKSNLEKIEEEIAERTYHNNISDNNDLSATENDLDRADNIDYIMNLFEDLRTEKENMDSKWLVLIKQKELWDKKWNDLASELKIYAHNSKSAKLNLVESNSKKKTKKVISTKVRRSFFISPKSCLSVSKPSTMSSSKTCLNIKKNFNVCKTPISSDKRLNRFRKSGCYTPNTLSIMVDDQEKDIFGDL